MKKKTFIAAISVLVVLSSLFWALQSGQIASANPYFRVPIPQMYITSPTSSTFLSNNLTLTFGSDGLAKFVDYSHVEYSLDGIILGRVDGFEPNTGYSFALTNLAEGEHTVSVTATVTRANYSVWYAIIDWTGPVQIKDTVTFTVDTVGPNLVFWTPQNKSFSTDTVAIDFTAKEPLNTICYNLDGQGKCSSINLVSCHIYAVDNYQITLGNLRGGSHSLKVYAKDSVGNMGESETLQFTVNQETQPQQPEPSETNPQPSEPFPTTLVATTSGAVIVAVVSFGLFSYLLRHNRKNSAHYGREGEVEKVEKENV